jgi:antitoxin VapB
MAEKRLVRLFRNGNYQAVRIPKEFEFEGEEAILRKEGDRLILEPIEDRKLLSVLRALGPLQEPFSGVDNELPSLDEPDL